MSKKLKKIKKCLEKLGYILPFYLPIHEQELALRAIIAEFED